MKATIHVSLQEVGKLIGAYLEAQGSKVENWTFQGLNPGKEFAFEVDVARISAGLAGGLQATTSIDRKQLLQSNLGVLDLPSYLGNALAKQNIHTLGELTTRSESDLLAIRAIGQRSVQHIRSKLHEHGLTLATKPCC